MSLKLTKILILALAIFNVQFAYSQGKYPEKDIRIIVPQAAGGPSDILGRVIAQKLSESLGKGVIVENRAGAGGNIGADAVAKAKPDGYTALITIVGILGINETLYKTLPFNATKDFDGVSMVASSPMVLVANPAFTPNSIPELIAFAKSRPPLSIPYGSSGTGSPLHIGGELINSKAGIKLSHVPYKGAAPALVDLLGGQIPLAVVGLPAALPYIKSGKLKALAVFSQSRSNLAPNIPTFIESGYPEIEAELVYGVFLPAGSPKSVINLLNQKIAESLKNKEVEERLLNAGFDVVLSTPAELTDYLKKDVQKWRPIVRASGASAE